MYYLKCSMDIKDVQDFLFYFGFGYSMSIRLFTMFLNFVQYILHNVQCVFANCSTYFHKCSVRVRKFFSTYIPIFVLKVHRICKTFIDFEKSSRIQKRFTEKVHEFRKKFIIFVKCSSDWRKVYRYVKSS